MKYVIHSKSEQGFWLMDFGWSYCISEASVFNQNEIKDLTLPLSRGNDTELVVYDYAD